MLGIRSAGTMVNDFLGFFNIKGAGIGVAIDSLTGNSAGVLANLHDQFLETAIGRGTGPMERMMGTMGGMGMGMPMGMPFGTPFAVPSPMSMYPAMQPFCGCGYAGAQKIDLAPGSTNIPFFSKLLDPQRRMAGEFERTLRHNPYARAAFEAQVGGRITDFGFRNDGKMTIQRFAPGYAPLGMSAHPMMNNIYGSLAGMEHAIMAQMGSIASMSTGVPMFGGASMFANPFMGMTAMGMSNMAGLGMGGFGSLGGVGAGSWNPNAMPGKINNTNPNYETAHQAEVAGVLADPSLTVEDKVTLMIMLIMKKMDKDIERQAQYINSIQQQQSNRGGSGGKGKGGSPMGAVGGMFGGKGGGGNDGNAPSIDVETMKLKRLIDKRSQMFDMLRQIIDKYNETAKGIIQSIGR